MIMIEASAYKRHVLKLFARNNTIYFSNRKQIAEHVLTIYSTICVR